MILLVRRWEADADRWEEEEIFLDDSAKPK